MQEYLDLLSKSNTIYIDNARLDAAYRDACYRAEDLLSLALMELRIESGRAFPAINAANILAFLESIGVDLDRYSRHTKVYSLDSKRVVEPLIERGIAVDLLTYWQEASSYNSYSNFLRKRIVSKEIAYKTSTGDVVLKYPTMVVERENLRAYYKDIAIVSLPKRYSNVVTVPKEGYHLVWCDYPQADWRFAYNLFIKDERNEQIMRQCEDAYEGLARIVENDKFSIEEFKSQRKEYKVNALKVFYYSQDKKPIPSAMRRYFMSCEKYRRYVHDLSILYEFKLPIQITSYFGHEQMIPEGRYLEGFLSKGLNTPIQTFTSHIVNETVFGVLEKFYSLGYTEEDIGVYYVRHDEPIFWFRDTIIKDAWVFKDCEYIHIDGFTPIKLDFYFGDYYKEVDEGLTFRMNPPLETYKDKLHIYPIGELKEYNPVPSVESFYIHPLKADDGLHKWVFGVFDYRTKKCRRFHSDAQTFEEGFNDCVAQICAMANWPQYVFICNDQFVFLDSVGDNNESFVKAVSRYDSSAVESIRNAG